MKSIVIGEALSRRNFLATTATLSAGTVALLAGNSALAQGMAGNAAADVGMLNVALGLEHEAINAYQLGAASGLLQNRVSEAPRPWRFTDLCNRVGMRDVEPAALASLAGQVEDFDLGNRLLGQQFSQLDVSDQLGKKFGVQCECCRSALSKRGVAFVQECCDV